MNGVVAAFIAGIVIFSVFITVLLGLTLLATTLTFAISTMFLVVLLILVSSKTRAFEELTASLKKKTTMEFWAPNRKVYRIFADSLGMGKVVSVKGVGNIMVTKDSIYTDSKTGAPQAMVVGELGITSPPRLLAAAQKMSDGGYEDITHVMEEVLDDKGVVKKDITIPLAEGRAIIEKLEAPEPGSENEGKLSRVITTLQNETVRVTDFLRFFKYEVTPASIKYVIEKAIADEMGGQRGVAFAKMFLVIALIMGSALAAIMLIMFAPTAAPASASPEQIQQICSSTCDAMRAAAPGGLIG